MSSRYSGERQRASLDVAAHDAYLKGMYALNKWTDDAMRRAIADFRDAIAEDSGFAPAYAALAEAHIWLYSGLGILPATKPCRRRDGPSRRLWSSTRPRRCAQGPRPDCHEPRLGSQGGGGRAHPRAPARPGLGGGASLERMAARAARKAARPGPRRAGRGRAAGPARSPAEDADRLRPPFPPRLSIARSRSSRRSWRWSRPSPLRTMRWVMRARKGGSTTGQSRSSTRRSSWAAGRSTTLASSATPTADRETATGRRRTCRS